MQNPTTNLTRARPRGPVAVGLVLGAAVLTVVAGCSGSSRPPSPATVTVASPTSPATSSSPAAPPPAAPPVSTPASTPAGAPPTGTAPPAAPGTAPSPARSDAVGLCTPTVTTLSLETASGGDEHTGVLIHVRNAAPTPCRTTGYPGVAFLDAAGQQAEQATRTPDGYLGGLPQGATFPRIVLQPGQEATALVEGYTVVQPAGTPCPPGSGLLVTLPDNTDPVRLPSQRDVCPDQTVHPLVPGDTGTLH